MGVKLLILYKDRLENDDAYQEVPRRPSRSDKHGITKALRKLHNDDLKNLCFSQSSFRIIFPIG